jgi:hypothetical protein
MSSAKGCAARRFGLLLGLGLALLDPGCARLRQERREEPPLGRLKDDRESEDHYRATKGVDLDSGATADRRLDSPRANLDGIADARQHPRAKRPQPEAVAAATRAPMAERPVSVALQSPTTIPVASDSDATAGPTARTTWVSHADRTAEALSKPDLAAIIGQARTRLDAMQNYQVAMSRQERIGDALQPSEDVVLSIRRQPKAVRLEWPDGPNKGREVLFAEGDGDGQMHVRMGSNSILPPMTLAPDSPLALRNSRHPITEAGLDTIVANLERVLEGRANGGRLTYEGLTTPDSFDHPCHTLREVRPDGETWVVSIDPKTNLPVSVTATAADGSVLERYSFRDLRANVPDLASASAFRPDDRWGKSGGLMGRLARSKPKDDDLPH